MESPDARVEAVLALVRAELLRVMAKFGPMASGHEGYAVILEELDEAWEEIKSENLSAALEEIVQVAAMAVRFVYDLSPSDTVSLFLDIKRVSSVSS